MSLFRNPVGVCNNKCERGDEIQVGKLKPEDIFYLYVITGEFLRPVAGGGVLILYKSTVPRPST